MYRIFETGMLLLKVVHDCIRVEEGYSLKKPELSLGKEWGLSKQRIWERVHTGEKLLKPGGNMARDINYRIGYVTMATFRRGFGTEEG